MVTTIRNDRIELPASPVDPTNPVEGTIYYNTNTKNVKLFDGTTWKGIGANTFTDLTDTPNSYTTFAKKYLRVNPTETGIEFVDILKSESWILVAASNAPQEYIANADYVCDGVNDEVEISSAIQDATANNKNVLLSPGTFVIQAGIDFPTTSPLVLSGVRGLTTLDIQIPTAGAPAFTIANNTQPIVIQNLKFISTTGTQGGIINANTATDIFIINNYFGSFGNIGGPLISLTSVNRFTINNNQFIDTSNGILISGSSEGLISHNIVATSLVNQLGFIEGSDSFKLIISDNAVLQVSGGGFINISSVTDSTISSNNVRTENSNIIDSCQRVILSANYISLATISTATDVITIQNATSDVGIVGNVIVGNGTTQNGVREVQPPVGVPGPDFNLISNNIITGVVNKVVTVGANSVAINNIGT